MHAALIKFNGTDVDLTYNKNISLTTKCVLVLIQVDYVFISKTVTPLIRFRLAMIAISNPKQAFANHPLKRKKHANLRVFQ